jgi:hypothetical protein
MVLVHKDQDLKVQDHKALILIMDQDQKALVLKMATTHKKKDLENSRSFFYYHL